MAAAPPAFTRWATRKDAPILRSLLAQAMQAEGEAVAPPASIRRAVNATTKPGPHRFVVAEIDGRVVGCTSLHQGYSTFAAAPTIFIEDLFVEPEHRGRGVARALLAFADDHAKSLGAGRLELHVLATNRRARRLYRALGYDETPYLWLKRAVRAPRRGA